HGAKTADADRARDQQPLARRDSNVGQMVAELERFEDVTFDVDLAGNICPRESELARRGKHITDRVLRAHDDARDRVGGPGATAVVAVDGDGQFGAQYDGQRGRKAEQFTRVRVTVDGGPVVDLHVRPPHIACTWRTQVRAAMVPSPVRVVEHFRRGPGGGR